MNEVEAIGWSIRAQYDRHEIVAQVHMAADSAPAKINAVLDKIARAQDRQAMHYKLEALQERLEQLVGHIAMFERDLVLTDETARARWDNSGRRGAFDPQQSLTGSERNARMSCENNLKSKRAEAEHVQAEIRKLEATLAAAAREAPERKE